MSAKIFIKRVDINTASILNARGLGDNPRVNKYIASQVARFCDPYVPMQQGTLKNTRVISSDGSSVTYVQPYAHYHYVGEAMAGRAPKQYTGKQMDYHGGPMRGPQWDKRMLADRGDDLGKSVAAYVGGDYKK